VSTTGYRLLDRLLTRVNGQRPPEPPPPPEPTTIADLYALADEMVSGPPIDALTDYDGWAHRYETLERAVNTPWLIAWPAAPWPADEAAVALAEWKNDLAQAVA
jgi:hypothetical protein